MVHDSVKRIAVGYADGNEHGKVNPVIRRHKDRPVQYRRLWM